MTDDQLENRAKMRIEGLKARKMKYKNPDLAETIKHPEKFIMEYREKQKNYVQQKKRGQQEVVDELKGQIILALRIRGDKNLSDRQKILLKTLKLKKMHDAVIIRMDKKVQDIFKICEPFITYGYV